MDVNIVCKKCLSQEESIDHILWSLDSRQRITLMGNLWNARNIFHSPKLKAIWNIVLSAALWTIWLGRNELYFQDIISDSSTLILLVKIRSFKWILAAGEINSELESLWNVNPVGAYLL